jgi:adenylyltransferase/sulfurtransferase
MSSYRDFLQETRQQIDEIDAERARELHDDADPAVFLDVREREEWDEGHIPGAVHLPRGWLESRIEQAVPDRAKPIVAYCASGNRSTFATRTLEELGYENVVSLAGGINDWKRHGYPLEVPTGALGPEQRTRYSRHLLIPEVGEEGQLKLLQSRILLIGAGGLGSPAALYLAAAGVGTLGIIDADVVDETNLQRQILHSTASLGEPKVESAARTIRELNPDVEVKAYKEQLTSENIERILADGWDVIVDGADNFPTRYLVNDAAVWHDIPLVHGSIFRFEGQATVFAYEGGPCYRCLYPEPPPPGLVPSCAEGGVLGILPGVIGLIQATETVKLILGKGEPLVGRLMLYDALAMRFRELKLRKNPECPVCGEHPTVTKLIDYQEFCGIPQHEPAPAPGVAEGEIDPVEVKAKIDRGDKFVLVDVREPHEYQICNIPYAKLIPLGDLPKRVNELNSADEIVAHCKSGMRSAKAVEFLKQAGFKKVKNMKGGIVAWSDKVDPRVPKY